MNTFVTLATNDFYLRGAYFLQETLKKVESKYPLLVMIPEELLNNPLSLKIDAIKIIKCYKFKGCNNKYADTLNKFQVYDLIEYEKIVFLDADLIAIKNIDFLFDYDFNFFTDLYYPSRYGSQEVLPFLNCILLKPKKNFFKKCLEINEKENVLDDEYFVKYFLFSKYFKENKYDDKVNIFSNFQLKIIREKILHLGAFHILLTSEANIDEILESCSLEELKIFCEIYQNYQHIQKNLTKLSVDLNIFSQPNFNCKEIFSAIKKST